MMLNEKNINLICDLFDKAIMFGYNNIYNQKISYLQCFVNTLNSFNEETFISDEVEEIFDQIKTIEVNSEELRKALFLLQIKGYKQVNFPLDIITPDYVATIVSIIINSYYKDQKTLKILDPNIGIGNLMYIIANQLDKEIELTGIESHYLLADVAAAVANTIQHYIRIFNNDALLENVNNYDIIVSDIATYDYEEENYHSHFYEKGIRYYPHLLLEKVVESNANLHIYIIDKDFFDNDKTHSVFAKIKQHCNILALVALPTDLFIDVEKSKSIIVLEKNDTVTNDTKIFSLPKSSEQDKIKKVIHELKNYLNKKGENHAKNYSR